MTTEQQPADQGRGLGEDALKVFDEALGAAYSAGRRNISYDARPALSELEAAIAALTQPKGDDIEIAEAALQRFHDKFMERAHVDPGTGYPEYGSQEEYYADLCAALDSVKALQDVPADPREQEYEP